MANMFSEFNYNAPSDFKIDIINGVDIPYDYSSFMKEHNGGEGFIGQAYIIMFRLEELEKINHEYEIQKYYCNCFIFGSDGGGMHLAYNSILKKYYQIDSCNCDDNDSNRFFVADSLEEFFDIMQDQDNL